MRIKNTEDHFGIVAIFFHWVMAFLIIGMLIIGLYMTSLPEGLKQLKLFGWHKETGILILMLAVARSMWRLANIVPRLDLPWWEKFAARAVHYAFYVFMFLMPITGWLISSAAGVQVSFFGWFLLPNLIAANHDQMELFANIHTWLAYGLIATIVLHVCAAFKHLLIDKDDIFERMLS